MGEYVDIGGSQVWRELSGDGPPVVLLHGGLSGAESFDAQAPAIAEQFRVHVPERAGHGHTADAGGPLTYENMTAETIAYLEEEVGEPADLIGWSDGAIVAMLVALARPDLVRKLVLMGANFHYEGLHPGFVAQSEHLSADSDDLAAFREAYAAGSPDGADHWGEVFDKTLTMWSTSPTLTVDDLRGIGAPALVLAGDDDVATYEHTAALFEALPNGQLAIVPGTSHLLGIEKPDVVNRIIVDFLADGTPLRFLPIRFAETGPAEN
jgi:pimeloyl-ACP methyl ester carboxylesterase